ncbi:MAG: methionyl-tRNA formyltransferase [Alphaproteobacteria bacterium]|nr:methionyl-tRNA formyltransferase [Alphaproteobacteria bacterium]
MRIAFVGSVLFSEYMLKELIAVNAGIVGVVTKKESKFNADFRDLSPLCAENGIPCVYTTDINSTETIEWVKSLKPDVVFCFGWSNLIKKELLSLAPLGVIGFHPAALPANRGRHPLIWALALGLKETASTFFFMKEGADDGDILSQEKILIDDDDDAAALYQKVVDVAKKQVRVFIKSLADGTFRRIKQDASKANNWRKRSADDGVIRFSMNSKTIYNLTRALAKPYVGASCFWNGKEIKVWKTKPVENFNDNLEYGKVLKVENGIITVKTPDGAIELTEHEFDPLPEQGDYL